MMNGPVKLSYLPTIFICFLNLNRTNEEAWNNNEFLNAIKCLSLAEEESGIENESIEHNLSNVEPETFEPLQILSYIGVTNQNETKNQIQLS